MSAAERAVAAAGRALGREVAGSRRVGGGSINEAWLLELSEGERAFLKSRSGATLEEFESEAAGLRWLAEAGGLPAAGVLAIVEEPEAPGLVLGWIEPGSLSAGGEEELGRGLAVLHAAGAADHDARAPDAPAGGPLRLGTVELDPTVVGAGRPWSEHYGARLEELSRQARERDAITSACAESLARVGERLGELSGPEEPPARLHGDLWSGNVLADAGGMPWLIDPAAHGGHRETDLAMLDLFGSVAPRTLAAYEEVAPLGDGWRERVGLWQLQPLLVHAVLFGGSYGAAVERTLSRYH